MPRAASARKLTGFAPNTPGDDEPMAQTLAYAHHDPRRESYFPEDDTPHSPTMARPEPATSPLKKVNHRLVLMMPLTVLRNQSSAVSQPVMPLVAVKRLM
jgi:hypothetical protein